MHCETCFLVVYLERCSPLAAFFSSRCKMFLESELLHRQRSFQTRRRKNSSLNFSQKVGFCGNYCWLYLKDYLTWIWVLGDILLVFLFVSRIICALIIVTPSQWLYGLISKCGWYSKISNVLFHQHSSEVTCSLIRKSWKHFGHFWSLKTCLGQYQHRLALATTNADQLADFQIGADAIMIMITIRIRNQECVGCY